MSQVAEKRGGIPAILKDAAFVWEDPLDLEGELSEEERMTKACRFTSMPMRRGRAIKERRSPPGNWATTACRIPSLPTIPAVISCFCSCR